LFFPLFFFKIDIQDSTRSAEPSASAVSYNQESVHSAQFLARDHQLAMDLSANENDKDVAKGDSPYVIASKKKGVFM
jgi:hypothetical protein